MRVMLSIVSKEDVVRWFEAVQSEVERRARNRMKWMISPLGLCGCRQRIEVWLVKGAAVTRGEARLQHGAVSELNRKINYKI